MKGGLLGLLAAIVVGIVALAGAKPASAGTKNGAKKNGGALPPKATPDELEAVKAVQRELNDLGATLTVDGKVGPKSCAAALAAAARGRTDLHPDVLGWNCGVPLSGACALLPKSAPSTFKTKCMQALNSKDPDLLQRTAEEADGLGFRTVGDELRALAQAELRESFGHGGLGPGG